MLMDHLGSLQKPCLPRQESVLSNESICCIKAEEISLKAFGMGHNTC